MRSSNGIFRDHQHFEVTISKTAFAFCSFSEEWLKVTRNSFKKWPLNLWWISEKNFHGTSINRWFWEVTQKYELCVSFKVPTTSLMLKMMMNYFWGMVDRRETLSRFFQPGHCWTFSSSQTHDTSRAAFKSTHNLSSGFVWWSYAQVITTTLQFFKAVQEPFVL